MLKRMILPLALAAGLIAPSYGAGTIPFSLSQQLDSFGKPLAGCKFYTIQAGTTSTPQNAYQDSALTTALPNPQTCDASGRLPQMFLADGTVKVRLTDKNGVTIVVADNIQVIGPSGGGGGGGGTVDPTTILATGDLKVSYGTSILSGFVRANGRTIGSATSGATERANTDCQALFIYLWGADANLAVSGGRGASAAADFAANKTIALPDGRGRALASLADMGNTDNGMFSGTTFTSGNSTTLGSLLGAARRTLNATQIPAHTHPNTLNDPGHTHPYNSGTPGQQKPNSGGTAPFDATTTPNTTSASVTGITINNAANTGGGNPFDAVSPYLLVTTYIKL